MPSGIYTFPEGFLWGTATAAHQVEGRNTNDTWSAWEQEEGHIIDGGTAAVACDWWGGRWQEDFDRAESTFQNAHRMSIAWSRIQPEPDRWDETALDKYIEMLKGLRSRKMVPMVTLHHFSEPLWMAEMGGWENEDVIDLFAAFVRKAVDALKPYCSLWVTINEPNVFMLGGYIDGTFPPGKKDLKIALWVMYNLVRAHAAAYKVIHEIQPKAQVGSAYHYRKFIPATWLPTDRWIAKVYHRIFNDLFPRTLKDGNFNAYLMRERVPQAIGTQDFVGLNYYTNDLIKFDPFAAKQAFSKRSFPADALLSESGFIASQPAGMIDAVKWGNQFGLPMYITENGVEDSQDILRPRYLVEHLHALWRAINDNLPVLGYFHWTLVDNFEWERGWTQRFGLWGLDVGSQMRIRRPSVDLYAEICRNNGISAEMVEKYAPGALSGLFPG